MRSADDAAADRRPRKEARKLGAFPASGAQPYPRRAISCKDCWGLAPETRPTCGVPILCDG